MAKKVVASLQAVGKNYAKLIRMNKSSKTGAYTFKEEIVLNEKVGEILAKK